jgi:hypothetical protein
VPQADLRTREEEVDPRATVTSDGCTQDQLPRCLLVAALENAALKNDPPPVHGNGRTFFAQFLERAQLFEFSRRDLRNDPGLVALLGASDGRGKSEEGSRNNGAPQADRAAAHLQSLPVEGSAGSKPQPSRTDLRIVRSRMTEHNGAVMANARCLQTPFQLL